MSFRKIYAETAFVALGANHVRRETLRKAILADATLTPAETLEGIGVADAGVQSPENPVATGRTWGFQFAGAGPLTGPETTALDAIVAAHTGVWVEPVTPAVGGTNGKVWGWSGGVPGWVDPPAGGLSGLGAVDKAIVITNGTDGTAAQGSLGRISATGTLQLLGTDTGASQYAALIGHNGGQNERLAIYGLDSTPQTFVTHDPAAGMGVAFDKVNGIWQAFGASSGNAEWYQVSTPLEIDGFVLTWSSVTLLSVSAGFLTDSTGKLHRKASPTALNAATLAAPAGLDTGTMTVNRWYYVWMIRNNAGTYSFVFSLSASAPTLSAASFTATGYVAIARVGSFRTESAATDITRFFQVGRKGTRRFVNDSAGGTGFIAVSNGTATSATALGHAAGAGSLPSTAIACKVRVTTNVNASCALLYSTAMTNAKLGRVPISSTDFQVDVPCSAGAFAYINSALSGASTINIVEYTEEAPG